MAVGQLGTLLRPASLQSHDRDAFVDRAQGSTAKRSNINDALKIKPDGAHAGIVQKHVDKIGNIQHRLVTHADRIT